MGISKVLRGILDLAEDTSRAVKKTTANASRKAVRKSGVGFHNIDEAEMAASKMYGKYRGEKELWKYKVGNTYDQKVAHQGLYGSAKSAVFKGILGAEDMTERFGFWLGSKAYGLGKWGAKKTIRTPVADDSKLLGYDIGLTKLGATLAFTGYLGATVGKDGYGYYEQANYGDIEGGLVSKSVNASFTEGLDATLANAQSGERGAKNFRKNVLDNNLSARLAKVDPDIVFAMHTLRNTQGQLNKEVIH